VVVVSVLLGGREVLGLFAGQKPCLGCLPGPTTVTPVGAASFLKASLKRVFLASLPGLSGGNPRYVVIANFGRLLAW
jgi:hypothetical protein